MGLEIGGYALAAIAAGATIGKMSAEKEAEQANLAAIKQQSQLLNLQYQQKTLQNLDLTDKMLSKQAAQLSTRGVAFSSPSFNAIERETVNVSGRKQSNLNTELTLGEQGLEIEKSNVRRTLHAQLFGDVANFAFNALSFTGKLPRSEDI